MISGFSFVVFLTYFPSFLQAVFELSAFISGLLMLALTTPMLFCPFLVSKMLNSGRNTRRLALMMSLLMNVGLIVLAGVLLFIQPQWQFISIGKRSYRCGTLWCANTCFYQFRCDICGIEPRKYSHHYECKSLEA